MEVCGRCVAARVRRCVMSRFDVVEIPPLLLLLLLALVAFPFLAGEYWLYLACS